MNGTAPQATVVEQQPARAGHNPVTTLLHFVKTPRGIQALVVFSDILWLAISFFVFYVIRVNSGLFSDINGFPYWLVLQVSLIVPAGWLILFWFSGVYVAIHNRSFFEEYYSVLKVILIGFILLLGALFLGSASLSSDSRSYRLISILIYFCLMASGLGLGRYVVRRVVKRLRRAGIGLRRTIIVGESLNGQKLREMFIRNPELGYEIIGTVATGAPSNDLVPHHLLGKVEDIDRIILNERVEVTVLALDEQRELVPHLMTETSVADTTIKIIPDLYDLVSGQARAQHLYGIPLIEINPQILPPWQGHLKRALDIAFSLSVLVVGLPIWLLLAILIFLEDRGPIVYSQARTGLGGRQFLMHKFRSMRVDAESRGISWTSVNDPRVTRVGRVLRRLHLDEIPQFINVLVGDMSIVGPRPERPFYVEKFTQMLPSYPRRLRVKPGVTGWNQVHMAEVVETLSFLQERLRDDFFYIENISLRLDIEIIIRTIIRVIQRKGQA